MTVLVTDSGFIPDDWRHGYVPLAALSAQPDQAGPVAVDLPSPDLDPADWARLCAALPRVAMIRVRLRHFGDVRALGLLGSVEFVLDRATRAPAVPYGGPAPADSPLARLPAALRARRLHCAVRDNLLFVTPPLCISAADLQHGLALIDDALSEVTA